MSAEERCCRERVVQREGHKVPDARYWIHTAVRTSIKYTQKDVFVCNKTAESVSIGFPRNAGVGIKKVQLSSRASCCDGKEALRINEYVNMSICVYIRVVFALQCKHTCPAATSSRCVVCRQQRCHARIWPPPPHITISPYHRGRFPFRFRLTTLQRLPLVFFTPYEKVLHAASRVR